jgi:hypothetical protein
MAGALNRFEDTGRIEKRTQGRLIRGRSAKAYDSKVAKHDTELSVLNVRFLPP